MKKNMQGFTLIELMIVIAILGILIAIALPAYQDYTIRTKNAECLNVSAAAKLAVAETYQSNNAMPADADEAGYSFAAAGSEYCATVAIAAGVITATTQGTGGDAVFTLTPDPGSGKIDWQCTATVEKTSWVPAECRGS